jgi:hypothetical protein
MADIERHQRKMRENRQRIMSNLNKAAIDNGAALERLMNEETLRVGANRALSDNATRAQAHLDAICETIRVCMPGVVREALVGELSDLRTLVKEPPQRDSFSRGVWAGYDHLLTELISRLNEPRHSD